MAVHQATNCDCQNKVTRPLLTAIACKIKHSQKQKDKDMSDLPNSVTKEQLDNLIARSNVIFTNPIGTLTHCMIILPCGFHVTGESACIDPDKYDKAIGEKYALEQAVDKLWALEGYLLANDRYRAELASKEKEDNGNSYEDNASCSECKRSYLS